MQAWKIRNLIGRKYDFEWKVWDLNIYFSASLLAQTVYLNRSLMVFIIFTYVFVTHPGAAEVSHSCESHVLRADWLNSSLHVSVFWSSRLDPCAPKQRHTHARTHSLSHVQTRAHASHYTTSGGLKVDHYLLNRLPNKKRRIPLQACIKTLEAWRWSNIHHNWCVAKQITHISAHCSSYDSSNWTWQIP